MSTLTFERAAVRLSCVLCLLAGTGYAQLSTASVNGTVRDSSGSVVPDATVLLRNVDTSVERRSASNIAGNYFFLNIQPGKYTLGASKAGFTTSELAPITLVVNQTATIDFSLKVGAVQEVVTVQAEGAGVQAATAEVGTVNQPPGDAGSALEHAELHPVGAADAGGSPTRMSPRPPEWRAPGPSRRRLSTFLQRGRHQ